MKKIAVILIMLLLLTGCSYNKGSDETQNTVQNGVTVTAPVDDTVNGYKNPAVKEKTEGAYVANQKTKKFHNSNCTYAKSIGADNKYITDSRQQLINEGYSPCKKCNP